MPPLVLIVFSGAAIGNLALGNANSLGVLLHGSAAFNASVVSAGFVLGICCERLIQVKEKMKCQAVARRTRLHTLGISVERSS